jgi:hypothetical protein
MGSNTGSYIAGSPDMNQVKVTACKPNQMDYSFEKTLSLSARKSVLLFGVHYTALPPAGTAMKAAS